MTRNAIFVIRPYRWHGMWVFDDPRVGLVQEPFVAGADGMIDAAIAQRGLRDAEHGFLLVFSAHRFPGADATLEWIRAEGDGDVYRWSSDVAGQPRVLEGWLCPALRLYFPEAPPQLYVQLREAS